MTLDQAAEILLGTAPTARCHFCAGKGVVPGPNEDARMRGDREYVVCRTCNGACIVLSPIWVEAYLLVHPGDHAGVETRRREKVREAMARASRIQ